MMATSAPTLYAEVAAEMRVARLRVEILDEVRRHRVRDAVEPRDVVFVLHPDAIRVARVFPGAFELDVPPGEPAIALSVSLGHGPLKQLEAVGRLDEGGHRIGAAGHRLAHRTAEEDRLRHCAGNRRRASGRGPT